jgi:hypothetical protein
MKSDELSVSAKRRKREARELKQAKEGMNVDDSNLYLNPTKAFMK